MTELEPVAWADLLATSSSPKEIAMCILGHPKSTGLPMTDLKALSGVAFGQSTAEADVARCNRIAEVFMGFEVSA